MWKDSEDADNLMHCQKGSWIDSLSSRHGKF